MALGPRDDRTSLERYAPVVFAAIVVGALIAPVAWHVTRPQPEGTVAVIELSSTIAPTTAQPIVEDLREARRNDSIQAVVLEVNSPGGTVAASERLYMAVNETANQMPVVASVVGTGASGAYYAMLPARTIFVTPGSIVGSVGVRATLPTSGDVAGIVTTGPEKVGGRTKDELLAQVETLRRTFVDSVFKHRGDELSLGREAVAKAKVYTGVRAVKNGMADRIGSTGAAIQRAATLAGLDSYDVVRKGGATGTVIILASANGNRTVAVRGETFGFEGVETPTFLMLYGEVEGQEVIANASE